MWSCKSAWKVLDSDLLTVCVCVCVRERDRQTERVCVLLAATASECKLACKELDSDLQCLYIQTDHLASRGCRICCWSIFIFFVWFWFVTVQKYMRRRKYRIHAAFLSATMISAIDAPVEFEVSIGEHLKLAPLIYHCHLKSDCHSGEMGRYHWHLKLAQWRNGTLPFSFKVSIGEHLKLAQWRNYYKIVF